MICLIKQGKVHGRIKKIAQSYYPANNGDQIKMNKIKSHLQFSLLSLSGFLILILFSNIYAQTLNSAGWTGWLRISQSNCIQRAKSALTLGNMPVSEGQSWYVIAKTQQLNIGIKCVADDNSSRLISSNAVRMLVNVEVVGMVRDPQVVSRWRDCLRDYMRTGRSDCWAVSNPPPADAKRISWTTHPQSLGLKGKNGQRFSFYCNPGGNFGRIWGTGVYTDDSSICTAAVHAGLIRRDQGGYVTIVIRPGQNSYRATKRYGVQSLSYGKWNGSYIFYTAPR